MSAITVLSGPDDDTVYVHVGMVRMRAIDANYIVGAINERAAFGAAEGVIYSSADFVRDALIEAAHR